MPKFDTGEKLQRIVFLSRGHGYSYAAKDYELIGAIKRVKPDIDITVASYGKGLEYYYSRGVPCDDLAIPDDDDQDAKAMLRVAYYLSHVNKPDLVVAHEVFWSPSGYRSIDIGAHKGNFTAYVAQHVGQVIAFEPDGFNAFVLKQNLALNNISNVIVERKAVCSDNGTKTFYRSRLSPASHSFFPAQFIGEVMPIQVECTSLEDVFRKHNIKNCGLVKMDCEGSEYEILFETPLPILKKVRMFQIELHENEQLRYRFQDAISFLSTNGFSVDVYGHRQPTSGFTEIKRTLLCSSTRR